jgi:hypothetical protein
MARVNFMSNVDLPRVRPAKPPFLAQGRKLLIVAVLVAGAVVGGRVISRRVSFGSAVGGTERPATR